jgi:BlaI family transcriptional regulator, penicillinase repressor
MKNVRPSDLEMQVLAVLWEQGPATVRQVLDRLPDGKQRAYTTVLSVMQVMEKKGLLDHTRDGLAHVYRPKVTRKQVCRPLMKELLTNLFAGKASTAMQFLLAEAEVDEAELKEIRKLINERAAKGDEK